MHQKNNHSTSHIISILSALTEDGDICAWQMSILTSNVYLDENARRFFKCEGPSGSMNAKEWIREVVAPEDQQMVAEIFSTIPSDRQHIPKFSFRIHDGNGNYRRIEQRCAVTGDHANDEIIWLSQDVTQRFQTAASLEIAERASEEILMQAAAGLVVTKTNGAIEYCNPNFFKMTGYAAAELVGRPFSSLIDEEDRRTYHGIVQQVLEGEAISAKLECRLIDKSGKPVRVKIDISLLSATSDGHPQLLAIIPTIKERQQPSELLQAERYKLKAIFDYVETGLAITDAQGKTVAANAAVLKIHDLENTEENLNLLANSKSYFDLYRPDGSLLPHIDWPSSKALRGEYVKNFEVIVKRKETGRSRFVRYSCSPIYDASGRKIWNVYAINDLTETRLLHEALSQSQRLEILGRLAGGVVHDFNNVLTVISGNLELIADKIADEKDRARIKAVLEAAEMGASINKRLLSIARRRSPTRKSIDIVYRIRGMSELLKHTIGDNIALVIQLPSTRLNADVDPGDLDAAFLNLATNGRDAMPDGGTLSVSVDRVEKASGLERARGSKQGYLLLTVKDTGFGMSANTLRMAAEPFFTTKASGKGVGLGLTGVYAFADQNGGHVEIDSKVGHGTEVRIYLPEAEAKGNAQVESTGKDSRKADHGKLVLVVEDNASVRNATREALLALGYRVEEAKDADEAMSLIEAGLKPACVLSDVQMSGSMDGYQLADHLRSSSPRTAIVLCTGYNNRTLRSHNEQSQADYLVLHKPYRSADLARAIQDAVETVGGVGPPTSPINT